MAMVCPANTLLCAVVGPSQLGICIRHFAPCLDRASSDYKTRQNSAVNQDVALFVFPPTIRADPVLFIRALTRIYTLLLNLNSARRRNPETRPDLVF